MSQHTTVTLSPQIVADLEPVMAETHESVESIVNTALVAYLRQWEKRIARDQLAREYDTLAILWPELAEDLADDKWLAVENEALEHFEKALEKRSLFAAIFSSPTLQC